MTLLSKHDALSQLFLPCTQVSPSTPVFGGDIYLAVRLLEMNCSLLRTGFIRGYGKVPALFICGTKFLKVPVSHDQTHDKRTFCCSRAGMACKTPLLHPRVLQTLNHLGFSFHWKTAPCSSCSSINGGCVGSLDLGHIVGL